PIHQADGHPAGPDQVLRPGPPLLRSRSRPAGRADTVAIHPDHPGPRRRPGEGGMMSRLRNVRGRLYRGEVSFDFVGRQKLWYSISGLILALSLIGLFVGGL